MQNEVNRRKFITNITKGVGSAVILSSPLVSFASGFLRKPVTVGEIIDLFKKEVPHVMGADTVDTLKAGDRDIVVTGIVTTMFATIEVIRKAIALEANFIIAHEPTFYNHHDETKWLENDEVYRYKADLLKQYNIAVWRNHDYIHSTKPDGVTDGLAEQLEWKKYQEANQVIYNLPAGLTLKALINHLKTKLHVQTVRYIGNLDQLCKKILFLPGAPGGTTQIKTTSKMKPDVLVCGEISEWETAEYVRDARAKGQQLSLVVVGHIASEEPGSAFMAQWLKNKFPEIKTSHVPAGNSLSFL
ncbi:Putative GTP cyclohydrolase 1 type 2, NIF3 family [Chitinophaga sp. CF118]|uniref:Nif3-like dinuclear metal center hexameric protein n=1 Tax=Chitinophaga sp. CF118 TaxID=1884367 RepID=UPI0008E716EB|nr:Nif3-like dinuclear metal center hexameric protein [Chitinophaga sp. CF118]SFE46320.1 Putative GTP cyclohydrolase 1 type 2, NIF3 family [Chitinophaga sp. CF118]